jgi:hypothetical protein
MSPVSPFGNPESQVVVGIPGVQEKDSNYDSKEKKEPTPEEELSRVIRYQGVYTTISFLIPTFPTGIGRTKAAGRRSGNIR